MPGKLKPKKVKTSTSSGLRTRTTTTKIFSKPRKSGVRSVSKVKEGTINFKPRKMKPKTSYMSTRSKKGRLKK